MQKYTISLFALFLILSCEFPKENVPNEGRWLAELEAVDPQRTIPFNFDLVKNKNGIYEMKIYNAEETISVDEIEFKGDSIFIRPPVFENYIAAKFTDTSMQGSFIKESVGRIIPFRALFGERSRFRTQGPASKNVSGQWEVKFNSNTDNAYMAKGIFVQNGGHVTGTFRTTTGDYRYLEGVVDGDSLKLSAFDGSHAFAFVSKVSDSTILGTFYSGGHYKETFEGKHNEGFELPNEDSLTFLKEEYEKLAFSFPDMHGKNMTLDDARFKDKVVIVQLMGTWCPNCLDETKFLVSYLKDNPEVEVVALAFEYAKTEEDAFKSIKRLKDRIGVEYPILLAQFGTSNKQKAQEKLPMLNHVLSYPTTIFLDRKGNVRKIHTGFNGPATGEKYTAFKKEFEEFVGGLLKE